METIEEKAKRYDEAYKVAESIHRFSSNPAEIKRMEEIFPSLKEYEGERIKNVLIGWINLESSVSFGDTFDGFSKEQILAWLEKQGEQKPADKIEPKFKVGDWVIDKQGIVHQVANVVEIVSNHTYGYDVVGGGYFNDSIEGVRLWNISDAKDGDVLVDSLGNVCIYQEPSTKLMYHSHCYGNHKYFICMGGSHEIVGSYPATKEQREQLEKSMADAGYAFDFEKKELKKIEQKPPIVNFKARDWYVNKVDDKIYNAKFMEEQLTNQKRRLEIEKAAMSATGIIEQEEWFIKGAEWSDKNSSYISSEKQGEQKSFDYENANIPQKDSTWSEEDKHWMQKVIDFMNHPDLIKATPTLAKDTINWLKSLKDRYACKPAMSK